MNPASKRYRALVNAIVKNRRALLPSKFSPTGTYKNHKQIHLRTISFRILAHAEFESYLEERALHLLNEAWKHWKSNRTISDVLIAILAFSAAQTFLPPDSLGGSSSVSSYEDIDFPLQKAQGAWRAMLKQNHGIKEKNILALFLPLGLRANQFDGTFLADMTSYGASRGEVAHNSNHGPIRQADPKTEFDTVTRILKDLLKIDALIDDSLRRLARFSRI